MGARSGKDSVLGKEGWSVHMFSQAGSASDGVAWISTLLTAFYGGVSSYYDEQTLSRKRDRRMQMQIHACYSVL
jgi:hypothetical protein